MKPSRTKPDKRLNYTTAHFKVTHELRRGLADISLMAAMGQKRTNHLGPKSAVVRSCRWSQPVDATPGGQLAINTDDGLLNARPIAFGDSPRKQLSHNTIFS